MSPNVKSFHRKVNEIVSIAKASGKNANKIFQNVKALRRNENKINNNVKASLIGFRQQATGNSFF